MEIVPIIVPLSAAFSISGFHSSLVAGYIGPGVGLGSLGALIGLAMGILSACGLLFRWVYYKCTNLLRSKE